MKREASIELFRCLCMFGVCLLHALDQGGYADPHRGLDNLMTPSVVGFLFISGWFGVKLKVKSVLKLVGIGLYCGATLALVYDCVYLGKMDVAFLIKQAWMYCRNSWFLWCYLAMMILAPLFDSLFDNKNGGGEIWAYCEGLYPPLSLSSVGHMRRLRFQFSKTSRRMSVALEASGF